MLRKEMRLTQQEFAARLGVPRNNIAAYETGKSKLSEAVITLICNKLGVNEDWLRTGEGEMFAELDPEIELMQWAGEVLGAKSDSFKKRFVRMLSRMTEEEWEWVEKKALELVNDRKE